MFFLLEKKLGLQPAQYGRGRGRKWQRSIINGHKQAECRRPATVREARHITSRTPKFTTNAAILKPIDPQWTLKNTKIHYQCRHAETLRPTTNTTACDSKDWLRNNAKVGLKNIKSRLKDNAKVGLNNIKNEWFNQESFASDQPK